MQKCGRVPVNGNFMVISIIFREFASSGLRNLENEDFSKVLHVEWVVKVVLDFQEVMLGRAHLRAK